MKTQQRFSAPVLAFGIIGVLFTAAILWYGIRHRSAQPGSPAPSLSQSAAPTNLAAPQAARASEPEAATVDSDKILPVIPISLANLVVIQEGVRGSEESLWRSLPHGWQNFAGVDFQIDGPIQLQGDGSSGSKFEYRQRVFIPLSESNLIGNPEMVSKLRRQIGSLQLVGAERFGSDTPTGLAVARLVWHYADGSSSKPFVIQHNVHLRDWWRAQYEEPEHLSKSGAKVVWLGENQINRDHPIRLYRLTLPNPDPDNLVTGLEFLSSMATPNLFFVGLTLDPMAAGTRPDSTEDLEVVDPPPALQLQVYVQSPEGNALPNASIRTLIVDRKDGTTRRESKTFSTVADGSARLRLGQVPERLELRISHADYCDQKMVWDTTAGQEIPSSYVCKLTAGITIGGIVVDQTDQPISDAKLNFYRYWSGEVDYNKTGAEVDFQTRTATTDFAGHWQISNVPEALLDKIGFRVSHPDFAGTNYNLGRADLENLRAEAYKTVLKRGVIVRGWVLNQSNQPISNARVWAGRLHFSGSQETQTDARGSFSFNGLLEGAQSFSVLAENLKPVVTNIVVSAEMKDIVFQLGAGLKMWGVVRDESNGEPISGVRLSLESEHGGVSQDYDFSMNTGSDGRFEWNGVPEEELKFSVIKQGFEYKRRQTLKAGAENVVPLRKCRRVEAQIVDAETGTPITKFRCGVGRSYSSMGNELNFYADSPGMKSATDENGRFTTEISEEEINSIKAEADDYAAKVEKLPPAENGIIQVILQLKPSAALRGMLVDMQGQPVPGATVGLTKEGFVGGPQISLRQGRLSASGNDTRIVTTDSEGKFTLGSPPEQGGIVVASADSGFARAPVEAVRNSGRLVLLGYGRVEGSIKIAGAPAAGHEFMFSMINLGINPDWETFRRTSDADGKFVFEKVPAGEAQVVRLIKTSEHSWMHSHNTTVNVLPGQTAHVSFGEEGVVVSGQVSFEVPPAAGDHFGFSASLTTKSPDVGQTFRNPTEAAAYFQSDEYKQLLKQTKHYGIAINPDGSFSVDSIPPGEYQLSVMAMKTKSPDEMWGGAPVASGNTTITVPANASPLTPIGLGNLILKPMNK